MMTQKHFIAMADAIKQHNKIEWADNKDRQFGPEQIEAIANVFAAQNPRFNREFWMGYIAGKNGPNGRAPKPAAYKDPYDEKEY